MKLVFISETYVLEFMQMNLSMYVSSPEDLLIALEELIESGELTIDEIREALKL